LVIREKISSLRNSGAAVIVTTHELQEAERVADRIVIMDNGRVVASGSPTELLAGAQGAGLIRFSAPTGLNTTALAETLAARITETTPGSYLVSLGDTTDLARTPQTIASITAWLAELNIPLGGLRVGASLEEVFLDITAGSNERQDRP
jgi:ABC-2 type transport system ATP-binding protein